MDAEQYARVAGAVNGQSPEEFWKVTQTMAQNARRTLVGELTVRDPRCLRP